jgi:hypothetical protein
MKGDTLFVISDTLAEGECVRDDEKNMEVEATCFRINAAWPYVVELVRLLRIRGIRGGILAGYIAGQVVGTYFTTINKKV